MRLDKFTIKSQELIQNAQALASRHQNQQLEPEHLLGAIWGPGYEQDDHVLRQAIYRLRKKIEPDPSAPRYIHNQPGVGYLLATP